MTESVAMQRCYVGRFDEADFTVPAGYRGHSEGYKRVALIDHNTAPSTVHTGLNMTQIEPGGALNPLFHAFEKGFYVLQGALTATLDGNTYLLEKDTFGLIPMGVTYAMYNAGAEPVRLLEMMAPQPKPADSATFQDTYFLRNAGVVKNGSAADFGDPRVSKYLGRFKESQLPQGGEIQAVGARGSSIYGVSIVEMIDRKLGAEHMAMFMVQFRPGGKGTTHDHMLEETYFLLSGEAETILDGEVHRVKAGDYVWTGVGCMHSFENVGDQPVRWIETQAPLPTETQAFRFKAEWDHIRTKLQD